MLVLTLKFFTDFFDLVVDFSEAARLMPDQVGDILFNFRVVTEFVVYFLQPNEELIDYIEGRKRILSFQSIFDLLLHEILEDITN